MKRWIVALCMAIVMALPCISLAGDRRELQALHDSVMQRYVPEEGNPEGERFHYYHSFTEIHGDCDDFMSAMYYELWKRGFEPESITYDFKQEGRRYRHTIVCAGGLCFDSNFDNGYSERVLTRKFRSGEFELVIRGELYLPNMYDMAIHEIIASMGLAIG